MSWRVSDMPIVRGGVVRSKRCMQPTSSVEEVCPFLEALDLGLCFLQFLLWTAGPGVECASSPATRHSSARLVVA